jgi:hypothetical protein
MQTGRSSQYTPRLLPGELDAGRLRTVAAENRLTADQLTALAPGDAVTIESAADFGRPRHSTGTVVRIEGPHIVVSWRSARGVSYLHRYGRRDGVRVGGGHRAELVKSEASVSAVSPRRRRQTMLVDAAYRAWVRNRNDVEKLQQLHTAVTAFLEEAVAGREA